MATIVHTSVVLGSRPKHFPCEVLNEKQARNGSTQKKTKLGKGAKPRRIDLSGCKLVAVYGQDPHGLESLGTIATKMGAPTKPGMRSIGGMKSAPGTDSGQKEAGRGKSAKARRIDLSGCKLVAVYGQDPHAMESSGALVTKIGTPTNSGMRSIARRS